MMAKGRKREIEEAALAVMKSRRHEGSIRHCVPLRQGFSIDSDKGQQTVTIIVERRCRLPQFGPPPRPGVVNSAVVSAKCRRSWYPNSSAVADVVPYESLP